MGGSLQDGRAGNFPDEEVRQSRLADADSARGGARPAVRSASTSNVRCFAYANASARLELTTTSHAPLPGLVTVTDDRTRVPYSFTQARRRRENASITASGLFNAAFSVASRSNGYHPSTDIRAALPARAGRWYCRSARPGRRPLHLASALPESQGICSGSPDSRGFRREGGMVDDLHLPNGNRLGDLGPLELEAELVRDLLHIVDPFGQPRFSSSVVDNCCWRARNSSSP